jgi:hypothetical protein
MEQEAAILVGLGTRMTAQMNKITYVSKSTLSARSDPSEAARIDDSFCRLEGYPRAGLLECNASAIRQS